MNKYTLNILLIICILLTVFGVYRILNAQVAVITDLPTLDIVNEMITQWEILEKKAYTPFCVFTTASLAYGARNENIRCVQRILNTDSQTLVATTGPGSPGLETNYFGASTRNAIVRFQTLKGIDPIGIIGPQTKAALITQALPVIPIGRLHNALYEVLESVKELNSKY